MYCDQPVTVPVMTTGPIEPAAGPHTHQTTTSLHEHHPAATPQTKARETMTNTCSIHVHHQPSTHICQTLSLH